jgi:molecular chaperone DnaK
LSKIIGIDLGTSNSCFSYWDGSKYNIIPNAEGDRTTPSIVAFTDSGELVGKSAKNQAVTNPENTIYEIKRFMGVDWNDPKTQADVKRVPYKCVQGPNNTVRIDIKGKLYSPEEISAKILSKIKKDAEAYLGETITEAIITVPAWFNNAQREATKDAGKIAGLEVKRIINEPTASSLCYGIDKENTGKVAVYDNGGGTVDVTILDVAEGVFEVKSTNGDTHCGGSDVDNILIKYINEEFMKTNPGIDLTKDKMSLQRVKEAAEKAKIELSSTMEASINLPFITADATGPKHLDVKLSRAKFESLIDDWATKTLDCITAALKDAGFNKSDINHIVMVGGTTRIPLIQKKVQEYFSKELDKSVNPDEVVGAGASIQAGILQGNGKSDILLLDVTPLSLGIETMGGIFTKMIDRNTTIPTKKSNVFSTAEDGQPAVTIRIAQGEREFFKDNKLLGEFTLDGIAPAPRGVPQIEISYDIDASGILTVTAKDKATGKEMNIKISDSGKMSDADIDRAIKEAEANAEADKKRKEIIDAKNQLEQMCYGAEKQLKDNSEHISEGTKSKIEEAVKSAKEKLISEDSSELKNEIEKLQQSLMEIGQEIYSKQQTAQPQQEAPSEKQDESVDVEFTEK